MENATETLKGFIDFLRNVKTEHEIAVENENEFNEQTQDLLHTLELNDELTYHQKAKLAKKISEVRKERRINKDFEELTGDLAKWVSENSKVLNDLGKILGAMRKLQGKHSMRVYIDRSKIVSETLDE